MIPLEAARERILGFLAPLPREEIPLSEALGRVPAILLPARIDLPPFDNSAVDGYAVRAAEISSASPEHPVRLTVAGIAAAGSPPAAAPAPGSCLRILTGAPLPIGADAVVMQEDTLPDDCDPAAILVTSPAGPWENVRFAGEDLRRGVPTLPPAIVLRPAHLALLAAAGFDRIPVHRRPRVALFSSGNELRAPGQPLAPGQIHDSNQVLMAALAAADGAEVVATGHIPDTLEDTVATLQRALDPHPGSPRCDVLITTGGVSVGDADYLKPAWTAVGGTLDLWRIAMKPGKPFAWGRYQDLHWFGLPGNPVSAFVTWTQLVRPALRRLLGADDPGLPRIPAFLAESIANRSDRRHFVRVVIQPDGRVRASGTQGSHRLSSLAIANGLLDVPPQTAWPAGHPVQVEYLG